MKARNTLGGFTMIVVSILGSEWLERFLGAGQWSLPIVVVASVIAIIGLTLMLKDIDNL